MIPDIEKKKPVTICLTQDVKKIAEQKAREECRSLSGYIARLITTDYSGIKK